jgi:RNA polymerase sigma-70 factor (ECF subfamily)
VVLSGESPEQTPEEATEVSMRRERIREAVAQLPLDQRQALLLAYFDGYTQSQIAEILKQPLGTIKTRLRLAMQKLHTFLQTEQEPVDTSVNVSSAYNISKED